MVLPVGEETEVIWLGEIYMKKGECHGMKYEILDATSNQDLATLPLTKKDKMVNGKGLKKVVKILKRKRKNNQREVLVS